MTKQLLFLCTGNYYRSRFAEIVFNYLAPQQGLDWVASSRGLCLSPHNLGPISKYAIEGLKARQIPLPTTLSLPRSVTKSDLVQADLVIAVKEAEHRPLLAKSHPDYVDQVTYWHVHDLDQASAEVALAQLEEHVQELIQNLQEVESNENHK